MNGATEATLAELLAVARATNVNIEALLKLTGGSGGGAGVASAGKAAASTGVSLGILGAASNVVSGAFNIMGNILGKVVGGFADTAKNLFNFAKSAAAGTARLSDFYDAFKDLPFFIGTVASLFADVIRYSEGLLDAYRRMSNGGATFSGNLFELSNQATRAFLTVREFTDVISRNTEFFASMGGSVRLGIGKFVEANAALMGPGSPYGRSILALGVTASEASEYLLGVMKAQGALGKSQSTDASTLAKYTAQYITELDILSRVTGRRREQIDAEVKKAEEDQLWQVFVDSMSPDERQKTQILLAQAETYNGKAAVEQLKASLRGVDVPVGDLSRNLAVASGGVSLQGNVLRNAVFNAGISIEQAGKISTDQQLRTAQAQGQFYKTIGNMGVAAGVGAQFVNAQSLRIARYIEAAGGNYTKALELAAKDQKAALGGNAGALANAEQNIKLFGTQLMNIVNSLIGPIASDLIKFGQAVTSNIVEFVGSPKFKDAVNGIVNWFTSTYKYLSGSQNLKDFWSRLGNVFQNGWDIIKPPLIEMFNNFVEFMKPYMVKMVNYVADAANAWLFSLPGGSKLGAEDPEKRKLLRDIEDKQQNIQSLKEELDRLKANPIGDSSRVRSLEDRIEHAEAMLRGARASYQNWTPSQSTPVSRASGSLGMTGKLFENWGSGKPAILHNQEAVVTPEQMGGIINNSLAAELQTLNNQVATLLRYNKETAEYTRRTVDATKGLSGNLFPTI